MAKEKFNPIPISDFHRGDKVVPKNPMSRIQGNNIGTVRKFLSPGVLVDWRGVNGGENTSFYDREDIKHAPQKGEQLLLDFMND